jgi:hypothetical protein
LEQFEANLVHEGEELIEEAGNERLDAGQIVLVEGIHQVPQGRYSIHPHLPPA